MKKITKTFVALFVVFVLVATMACAVACENDPCKDGHTASLVRGTAATCTEGGTQDYYKCAVCNKLFSDEACQNEIQDPIPTQKLGHNTTGTWLFNDDQHYKFCDRCNKNVEAADHSAPDAEGKCSVCGKQLVAVKPADKGSLDDPYTVAQAVADCKQLASGEYSEGYYYVKGIVTSKPAYSSSSTTTAYSFSIKDALTGEDTLDAYYVYLDGQEVPCVNDTVVIYGKLEFYSTSYTTSYEVTAGKEDDPHASVKKVTRGESTITVDEVEGATVTIDESKTSGLNGTTFTFSVSVDAGYTLNSVKVNGEEVTAEQGKYTGTIAGNTVVRAYVTSDSAVPTDLSLTKSTLFASVSGNSYAAHDGDHEVGDYSVNTSNVMGQNNSNNTYGRDALQFKANGGELKVSGKFAKLVIKIITTYEYSRTNKFTVTVGGVTQEISTNSTDDTGETSGSYSVLIHTMEYTLNMTEVQEISIKNANSQGALYALSIEFTVE